MAKLPTRPKIRQTNKPVPKFIYRPKTTIKDIAPLAPNISTKLKGMSAEQLLKSTVAPIKAAADKDGVRVQSFKVSKDRRTLLCETVSAKGTKYRQSIENRDPNAAVLSASRKLVVGCTCEFFRYFSDWVLHQAGASDLKFATDEPPDIKNPRRLKIVCKHLVVALELVQDKRL